ncbi:unnamed protein product [Rotaria sordida]|uniref:Protein kinase domain-containing protein n=1 Tax=Rotaria sordida TaxID=392033 RepID=A0A814WUF1_9BILA|nr:unnamed protein product [Rotaria sordida]
MDSIRCPNIVSFYGACTKTGKYALVMEYMSLGSLYKILHEDNRVLTWLERLSVAFQTASGINYLHQLPEPILHRDIKSLNVLMERAYEGYTAKVCDFGLARTRDETTRQTTSNPSLVCTLKWTAPEILLAGHHTDKTDIYSLGIVYWELATSEIPYDGLSDGVIRAFVLAGDRASTTTAIGITKAKNKTHSSKVQNDTTTAATASAVKTRFFSTMKKFFGVKTSTLAAEDSFDPSGY